MSFTRAFHIFRGGRISFHAFLSPGPLATESDLATSSGRPPTPSGEEAFCRVNEAAVRVFLGREMNNVAIEDLQALEMFSQYQGTDFTPCRAEATLLITQTAFYTIGCWDHWTFQLLPEASCHGICMAL